MKLKQSLIKKYAKTLTAPTVDNTEKTLYGTAVVNGESIGVIIDGSSITTPAANTVDVDNGDRVTLRIIDHRVVIDGNVSKPPDSAKADLEDLDAVLTGITEGSAVIVIIEHCFATENYIPDGQTFEDIQYSQWVEDIENLPTFEPGYYVWSRKKYIYNDGFIQYDEPYFDAELQASFEVQLAVEDAQEAAETAAGIADYAREIANTDRRIFNSTPVPPYDVDDLWFDSTHSKTYLCKTAKASGASYSSADWEETSYEIKHYFWHDPSGAHIAENQGNITVGYSQTIASNGIVQMYNNHLVTSWTATGLNFYDNSDANNPEILVASYAKNGITHYIKNKLAMALTDSGLTLYKSDGSTPYASYLTSGISFATDVPFTIGNNSTYIKWKQVNGAWKLVINADEIQLGGSDIGGAPTITSTEVRYAVSSSDSQPSSSSFSYTSVPSVSAGQWLWTRTTVTYSDGNSTITYSKAKQGSNGSSVSISSTEVRYASSSSGTTTPSSFNYTSPPTVSQGYYLWTRTTVTYSDGSSTTTYSVARQGVNGSDGIDVTSQYVTYVSSTYGVRVYSTSGSPNNYAQVNSSGLSVVVGGTTYASFGSTCTIGSTSYYNLQIDSSSLVFRNQTTRRGAIYATTDYDGRTCIMFQGASNGINNSYVSIADSAASMFSKENNNYYSYVIARPRGCSLWTYDYGTVVEFSYNSTYLTYGRTYNLAYAHLLLNGGGNNSETALYMHSPGAGYGLRMYINSSGNFGLYHGYNDIYFLGYNRADDYVCLRGGEGDGTYIQWYNSGAGTSHSIQCYVNSNDNDVIIPNKDNKIRFGTDDHRFYQVRYGSGGCNSGSDLKDKLVDENFEWNIDEFISSLRPIAFKLRDSNDGEWTRRYRFGFGAQDVSAISKRMYDDSISLANATIKNEDPTKDGFEYHGEEIDDERLAWTMDYPQFIAPIVLELQRLMARVAELEKGAHL